MYIWYLIILTNLSAYLLYIFCCSLLWMSHSSIKWWRQLVCSLCAALSGVNDEIFIVDPHPHTAALTAYHIILYFSSFILCLLSIALLQSFTSVFTLCCYYEISLISFTHYRLIMKSLLYRLHYVVNMFVLSHMLHY